MNALSLKGVFPSAEIDLDVNGARRFSVAVGEPVNREIELANDGVCYWRLVGAHNQDLVTFDLLRKTGKLFGIEMAVYVGQTKKVGKRLLPRKRTSNGNPLL